MIGDSISYSYVDYASQSEGKIDYEIRGGRLNYTQIQNNLTSKPELDNVLADFLPRSWLNPSQWLRSRQAWDYENGSLIEFQTTFLVGVDLERETNSQQGPFLYLNGTPFTETINSSECVIFENLATSLNIGAGENITYWDLRYTDDTYTAINFGQSFYENYTIKAVVKNNNKFPSDSIAGDGFENVILINLVDFNQYYKSHYSGSLSLDACFNLIITFESPQSYYNTKDIPGTIVKIRKVGEQMINTLGFYNQEYGQNTLYYIDMPRVGILEIEQYINIGISIILLFVLILAVVISSVLINGILSTSVEEKIREFGVLRVLGGHRSLPIRLTVYQAFMLSGIGTAIGIGGGYAAITYGILPLLGDVLSFTAGDIVAILSAETLAMTLGVGIGISMVVGIMPALKVSRMSILGAINPYRQESVGTKMVKEESINLRYIITGIVMSGIAAFVLFIVPQIILTLDIGLIVAVLVILLSVFLFGATLVGLGFLPPIQNMIRRVFSIITHKTKEIIRISLLRYTRRNTTTVIMFSISFSFITLVSTVLGTQSAQTTGEIMNSNGSDLVVDSRIFSWTNDFGLEEEWNPIEDPSLMPLQSMSDELISYEGVVKTSTILATTLELDGIRGSDYSITMSDRVKYKSHDVHGVAVDSNYLDTIYNEYIVFSQGNKNSAFNSIFNEENKVIVSTALAMDMQLGLHDECLLWFEWGDDETNLQTFEIVGVVDNLPGITSVQKRPDSAEGSAIILSQSMFRKHFQLPAGDYYTSRIFIQLGNNYQKYDEKGIDSDEIEDAIREDYEDVYDFRTRNSYRQGGFQREIFSIVEALFIVILTFAVVISLFGLTSAAYSTILERTREVGIIETLGLRKTKVSVMFIVESEIIMISAAVLGSLIGIILTWIFYLQIASFSTFPLMSVFTVPWDIILIELAVAGVACLIAMAGLVQRVQKMELMEIFRKTL